MLLGEIVLKVRSLKESYTTLRTCFNVVCFFFRPLADHTVLAFRTFLHLHANDPQHRNLLDNLQQPLLCHSSSHLAMALDSRNRDWSNYGTFET